MQGLVFDVAGCGRVRRPRTSFTKTGQSDFFSCASLRASRLAGRVEMTAADGRVTPPAMGSTRHSGSL